MLALAISFARFGRLPQRVRVDNGAEFDNQRVRSALASLGMGMDYRVADRPGSGHRVENAFSRLAATLDNLPGNVKVVKKGIVRPNENNPRDYAKYTLKAFQQLLEEWCYETFDILPLPSEAVSRRAKCEQATREHGSLLGRLVSPALVHAVVNSSLDARKLKYRAGSAAFRIDGFFYVVEEPLAGLNGQVCHVHATPRDAAARTFMCGVAGTNYVAACEQRWREVPTQRVWAFTQELRDMRRIQKDRAQKVEL